jgi:hypothetical protein
MAIAGKLRAFADEASNRWYHEHFCRGAEQLELEAVGLVTSAAVISAIRAERLRRAMTSRMH